jgi:hypothetical protein
MLFFDAILDAISKIRAQIVHKIRVFFVPDFHTFSSFFIHFATIVPLWSIAHFKTGLKALRGSIASIFASKSS